jgi:hypothetical protein
VLIAGGPPSSEAYLSPTARAAIHDPNGPSGDRRESTDDPGVARTQLTATFLADGRVLVAGGYTDCGATAFAEISDPASGTWTPTGPLPHARSDHVAALLPDGTILVASGASGLQFDPMPSEGYDASTGTWPGVGWGGRLVSAASAQLLDGTVLVTGGIAAAFLGASRATRPCCISPIRPIRSYSPSPPSHSSITRPRRRPTGVC